MFVGLCLHRNGDCALRSSLKSKNIRLLLVLETGAMTAYGIGREPKHGSRFFYRDSTFLSNHYNRLTSQGTVIENTRFTFKTDKTHCA